MKRIIFLFTVVALAFPVQGQKNIRDVEEINFYGVDFSKVKIYGAMETPSHMKSGLYDISMLFITEQGKYDITHFMGKQVAGFYLENVNENNRNMDETAMISGSPQNPMDQEEIEEIINRLSNGQNDNVGLVFIAETLNRARGNGTFHVVFFDEATKEIIYRKKATGKSGGLGTRNYWAKSVYNILKNWKY